MNKKSFGWYMGTVVAWIFCLALATGISAVIVKLLFNFLTWLF